MRYLSRAVHRVSAVLSVAFVLLVLAPSISQATDVRFVGTVGNSISGSTAVLTADKIQNFGVSGVSEELYMELWALDSPYSGGSFSGHMVAYYRLNPLTAGSVYNNVSSGSVVYTSPPNGTWSLVMMLTEFAGISVNNGFVTRDWVNISTPLVIGPVTPHIGSWWNPSESGSGYALDYRNGILAVTIYSFLSNGAPQWYLAVGPLSGNTFTATLDKYAFGQCISCPYPGGATPVGNDGTITIVFSSATAATAYLPGGRVTPIQVFNF